MLRWLKRFLRNLIRKSTHVRHEPLNKVSIVILILIDIFVLINVFSGLNSISAFPLAPHEQYPCYGAYQEYQRNTETNKDLVWIRDILTDNVYRAVPSISTDGRLGEVSNLCDRLIEAYPKVKNPETLTLNKNIETLQAKINQLKTDIATYKQQYDSTLLEKIAGQDPQQSINKTTAEKAKADIQRAEQAIQTTSAQLQTQQTALLNHPTVRTYLDILGDRQLAATLESEYKSAQFWHPNQQFALQALFLLPLILVGYLWHSTAVKNNLGTQALLSWHLLLIFCIPFLIKILEFIQFGNLAQVVFDVIIEIFGGLVFIASYALIIIIPLLGLGLIKFLQRFVFNPKVQAKGRIQKHRCIQCGSRLRTEDEFCPFCGFEQCEACPSCGTKTYKYTEFCRHCGCDLAHPLSDRLPPTSQS